MKIVQRRIIGIVMAVILVVGCLIEPSQPAQAAVKKIKITQSLKLIVGKTDKIKLKNNKILLDCNNL